MGDWKDQLVEAHIRDWERRRAAGELGETAPLKLDSWEAQTFRAILELWQRADRAQGAEREQLLRQAEDRRVQLLITVERDRPRMARALEARLFQARRGENADSGDRTS